MSHNYQLSTKIIFGRGSLDELSSVVDGYLPKKILLVTGKNSMKKAGIVDKIKERVTQEIILYDKASYSPPEEIDNGVKLALVNGVELVIGLGGGSAMDVAKCIAILATNKGETIDFLKGNKELTNDSLPTIMIPTTAGTASELTPWASVWVGSTKYSLSNKMMTPEVAILDPLLSLTVPKSVTASTGMDALSSAIEAYWSIYSSPLSDVHAEKSIKLINEYLEKACDEPNNPEFREKMLLGSLEAGRAFSQTKTTACHAVSYPMTGHFGVQHGHACGLSLPSFFNYNYKITKEDCNDPRGPEFVQKRMLELAKMLGCDTVEEAANRITEIMQNCGLDVKLSDAGVKDIDTIIKNGFNPDRVVNNPRVLTEDNLREILTKIY